MNVLLLGDSHTVGSYGTTLERLFRESGAAVTRVGRVGARADSFLGEGWKRLDGTGDWDAAKLKAYDLAILSLGTNDAAASDSISYTKTADRMLELAGQVRASTVWYVGPPAFSTTAAATYNPAFAKENLNSRASGLWSVMRERFSGRAIDPREATRPYVSAKDIHFGAKGGEAWARYVFSFATGQGAMVPAAVPGVALFAVAAVATWLLLRR